MGAAIRQRRRGEIDEPALWTRAVALKDPATPQVGVAASSTSGTWNLPVTIARQWLRCDATGAGCTTIAGATAATYTPTTADRGARLRVRVTASVIGLQPNLVLTADSAIVT